MLERTEITAEFLIMILGNLIRILCLLLNLLHILTLSNIFKNNRAFILVSTYASFIQYLKLDYFGYFNMGFSVAHMNFY